MRTSYSIEDVEILLKDFSIREFNLGIDIEEWESMSEEQFIDTYGSTPLKRSGLERIKQNIKKCLWLGLRV